MTKLSKDWINIAQQVVTNPFVKIPCPNCGEAYLQILIVPWKGEEEKVDIHLICESCTIRNTITKEVSVKDTVNL